MKKIIYLICSSILLLSCNKEELQIFNDKNELYFGYPYLPINDVAADTLHVSFRFIEDDSYQVYIPVKLSGMLLSEEKEYQLEIDSEKTTALPKNYKFEKKYLFPANAVITSANFTVFKSDELNEDKKVIAISVVANENFGIGQREYAKTIITITNNISRPQWWDSSVEKSLLGTYSDKKYETFAIFTGVSDLTHYPEANRWALAVEFKNYLELMKKNGTTIMDGNEPMKVPVIG